MVMESRKVVGNKVDKKIKLEVQWRYDQQLNPMWHRLWELLLKPKHPEEGSEPKDMNGVNDENCRRIP